jgi:acyl-CoA synthetase (AMP-forming)/AMP-acid ligase II
MSPADTLVSWLPIHHDMGFVDGVMAPLSIGARLVLLPTESYIRDPTRWLRLIATHKASHSVGPPSAYQLVSRPIYARRLAGIDLSSLRCSVIGAEPVSWNVIQKFEDTYAALGLRPGTLAPGYGMAEATLVITGDASRPRRLAWIDREAFQRDGSVVLAAQQSPGALPLVSNGPLMEGFRLRVVDAQGTTLPEGKQGRIHIAGPCVTRRYFGSDENPQPDGWLDTGDLGFVLDGEIYVTGRIKDVIIRGGVNVHAHDIEQAVLHGMPDRAQRAVAFAIPRSEDLRDEIVVGVELRSLPPDGFAGEVRGIVARDVGVQVDRVLALAKGTIPRTTSGKIQRGLARDLFRGGELGAREEREARNEG